MGFAHFLDREQYEGGMNKLSHRNGLWDRCFAFFYAFLRKKAMGFFRLLVILLANFSTQPKRLMSFALL